MRLFAAEDHLEALARLLEDQSFAYAPASLARTALETSARAWWLLEPNIGARGRAARAMTERLGSLIKASRFPLPDVRTHQRERIERLLQTAKSLEHEEVRSKRGKLLGIGVAVPAATGLIKMQLGAIGEIAYRDLSSIAHGVAHGLVRQLDAMPDPTGQHDAIAIPVARLESVRAWISEAVLSFVLATDRQIGLDGWDAADWSALRHEALKLLQAMFTME